MRKRIAAAVVTAVLAGTGIAGVAKAETKYERYFDVKGDQGIAFGGMAAKKAKCITNTKVVLRRIYPNEMTQKVAVTKTDANGEFGFQGLEPGVYFAKAPATKTGSFTCMKATSDKIEVS